MPRGDGTRRGTKARSGPSQPESERRARTLSIRLTDEQRAALGRIAARWGCSQSAAVVRLIDEKENAPG